MNRKVVFMGFVNKGYRGQVVEIQCDIRNGFPGFEIVGLPDAAILQARERVRTAMRNCGFRFPQSHVLISLSPSGVAKSGSLLDLGIALAILFAQNKDLHLGKKSNTDTSCRIMVAGELALDGSVVQTDEALGAVEASRENGASACLVPFDCSGIQLPNVFRVHTITDAYLTAMQFLDSDASFLPESRRKTQQRPIFSDILGLEREKLILSYGASGFHSILLFGPPGVGKTLLCSRLPLLVPRPDGQEHEEIRRIYGCARIPYNAETGPSRMIGHDCRQAQFIGGSQSKAPGEGSLSHRGVLLLDELDKFSKGLLEAVKDTYDKGFTLCSRSGELISYPARFLMAASMNPCSCTGLGRHNEVCICTRQKIESHWSHVGKPLIDRFDIRLPVEENNSLTELLGSRNKPDSFYLDHVSEAVQRQKKRYRDLEGITYNGDIRFSSMALGILRPELELYSKLSEKTSRSPREQIRCISLARTIADFNSHGATTEEDMSLAIELGRYGLGDYYWKTVR